MIQPFLVALQFLTRLPVRLSAQPSEKDIGRSLLYYPLVGLIIGALLVTLGWSLDSAPTLITAALIVTAWVMITGGLHLDGLADSADAWIGGMGDREKTLAIMKDPACGPAGVVAVLLIILLKFTALHSLLMTGEWTALFLAVIIGRTLLPVLLLTTPYVRCNGLGFILSAYQPKRMSVIGVAVTTALILLVTRVYGLWLLISAITLFLILRHMMLRRIGGTTGDTAGALVEATETTVLLMAVLTKI
jgi:adenosylcobinamide-GDP ribazoletransferase